MAFRRWSVLGVFAAALGLLGNDSACFQAIPEVTLGGDGGVIGDPDTRCAPLNSPFPQDLAFEPPDGDTLWVVDISSLPLVPFTLDVPPVLAGDPFVLPSDSDGDGVADSALVAGLSFFETGFTEVPALGLVTVIGHEEILVFDPQRDELFNLEVEVPAPLTAAFFPPPMPAPGAGPVMRTGLSTAACLVPAVGVLDSRGDAIGPADASCDGFRTSNTSGAAIVGAVPNLTLFVPVSNRGVATAGDPMPQFFPGAVLVYQAVVDTSGSVTVNVEPDPGTPVIYTTGFNPIDAVPYSAGGRSFVLVAVAGAVGAIQDNLATPVREAGSTALTPAAIDVIDADTLELVATYPLGNAGLSGELAIDPTGSVAAIGSQVDRWVLAVDLQPLASLPPPAGTPTDLSADVLYGAANPLVVTADPAGANPDGCPGRTPGVAFSAASDLLFASEYCDGTLGVFSVSAASTPPALTFQQRIKLTYAIDALQVGAPRGPGRLAVPPVAPSSTVPDLFVILGRPAGLLCAIDLEFGTAP